MAFADNIRELEQLNKSLGTTHERAAAAGHDFEEMSKSVLSYGKALFYVGSYKVMIEIGKWAWQQYRTQRDSIAAAKESVAQRQLLVSSLESELAKMKQAGVFTANELKAQDDKLKWARESLEFSEDEVHFRERVVALIKQQGIGVSVSLLYMGFLRDAWIKTLDAIHEYNRALVSARAEETLRYNLIRQSLAVQQEMGASTDEMVESSRALVEHGNHLTPAFQTNLKIVTQMRMGLHISAQSAAEMAVIFTRQLKVAAVGVADAISTIAANTGLATQKMSQFAVEIGRAMRLLGPGMKDQAAGVVKMVGLIAGRVEAMGGNAASVVSMYRHLTGGTDSSITARAQLGIGANIGTERGALLAFQRVADIMKQRITADPRNLNMFSAQLENVSEQLGMSAEDLMNLQQVMKEWNSTAIVSQTLEEAYSEQTRLAGESWKQIKASLGSLLSEALLPFAKGLQWVMGIVRDAIKAVASFRIDGINPLAAVLTVVLPVAALVAVGAITRLTVALIRMAASSNFASAALNARGLPSVATALGYAKPLVDVLKIGLIGPLLRLVPGLGLWQGGAAATAGYGVGASLAVKGGALGVALGAGILAGTLINKFVLSEKARGKVGDLTYRALEGWWRDWKVDKAKERVWFAANTGQRALQAAHNAAQALAREKMGRGSAEDSKKAMDEAVTRYGAMGWEASRTQARITGLALTAAQNMVEVDLLRRTTIKSEADRKQDEAATVALKQLDAQERTLEAQERAVKLQNDQARFQKLQEEVNRLQYQSLSNSLSNEHWNMVPALDMTNSAAYGPK